MMVNKINSVAFTGKIIDAHAHVGTWENHSNMYELRNYTSELDTFIKQDLPNGDNVEKIIVSNLDCLMDRNKYKLNNIVFISDELNGNRDLLEITKNNPKMIPIASCQPGYGSVDNIKKLFKENPGKFYGLKFHPECLLIPANDKVYDPYMEFARKNKLPCLFHSGRTVAHTYPSGYNAPATIASRPPQIYELAKRHKTVPVILAHLGGDDTENSKIAVDTIISSIRNKDANLYADISWVDCDNPEKPGIIDAIRRLKEEKGGIDRLMFGTDAPLGRFCAEGENNISPIQAYTNVVNDIKNAIKKHFPQEADEITEKIFYKNAQKLFFESKNNMKSSILGKILGFGTLGAGIIGGGLYFINNNSKTDKKTN